ncbi:secretion-regulating guanine nucleotide exchange factor-like isoform X1 [Pieris napi]|uniref:secretion-regulating guanine nucleotide exchange factor-like isoform X1 n=1 Tax=Pieris napi TaxID=78633 RepID=UPI001FBA1164|nr:secretion-regulating guanine nucleotide exchange factor-like isoform X1 [Pieris napi]
MAFTLWSWGANSHGQLGLNVISEQVNAPTKITRDFWSKTKQVACGGGHTLLLDDEGKLFACGWNVKKQLGLVDEAIYFERVWCLSGINFTNISCGWDFSCGVTDEKYLFVWGSNSHGQLGLPKEHFSDAVKPVRLQVNACSVSMGLRHTAIINSKGEVWTTGCGKHGQLGLGPHILISDRFQKVPLTSMVTHIVCGQNHTLAWSSDEKALYVWGDNKHSQLLLASDKYKKVYKPQKIDIDVKKKVKRLLSGWTNALLWLEDGQLLAWGRNNYGQLGTNEPFEGKIIHIKLPEERQVKDVVLGSEHTVCLATDNTLWAWGWNEHANTGTASEDYVFTPSLITFDQDLHSQITQIYAGSAHNFVVTEKESNEL